MKAGFFSYLLCAVAYVGLLAVILVGDRRNQFNRRLAAVSVVQIGWALVMATMLTFIQLPAGTPAITEVVRSLAWILFLLYLPGSLDAIWRDQAGRPRVRHLVLALACTLTVASILSDLLVLGERWSFGWKVLLAILGIFCVEQIYRNTPAKERWSVKFLALSMLGLFGFDLVMLSDALLFQTLNPNWWTARGFANALLVPLIAVASARVRNIRFEIGLSHNIAFHTATLALAGGYLIFVSIIGYFIKLAGGSLGGAAQALLVFLAFLTLAIILFASNVRSKIRVFIAKNFFAYQYDYRQEWLDFTDEMSRISDQPIDSELIAKRASQALCRLMEAKAAAVWIRDRNDNYDLITSNVIGLQLPQNVANSDPLVTFLRERDWVISSVELRESPALYGEASLPDWASDETAILVAPLQLHGQLTGFILLAAPRAEVHLNWEVRDLVKTLGRQTASYLAQQQATRKMVELQQFESFNKLSAFVVHDLKNLVAQLSLLLANAARHRDNPEFQADMLSTIENVLDRMQGLLLQLRAGTKPAEPVLAVDLNRAATLALESKGALRSSVEMVLDTQVLMVHGHVDRLIRVIGHFIQNADEACQQKRLDESKTISQSGAKEDSSKPKIQISSKVVGSNAVLVVKDYGIGMDSTFLRDKLFRPFNTTKGMGMGIGTFESFEYIREIGGTLQVTSEPSVGSEFTISLPLVRSVTTNA